MKILYYSGGEGSTPTSQILAAKHRLRVPLRVDIREWSNTVLVRRWEWT